MVQCYIRFRGCTLSQHLGDFRSPSWIVAFVTWCSFIGIESFLHLRGKNGEKGGVGKTGSNSDFNGIFSTSNWALHSLSED